MRAKTIAETLAPALALLMVPLVAATAQAARSKVTLEPPSALHFKSALGVTPAEVSEAVAAQNDPLSVVKGLHLYLQGGHLVQPKDVKLPSPYCRVDVDLAKVSAETAQPGSDGRIPISGPEIVLSQRPVRGDPYDYGASKTMAVDDKAQRRLVETRWGRNARETEGGAPMGRSIELRFRESPENAVSAIICVKKGADYPNEEDFQRSFGGLAAIELRTEAPSNSHAPTEKEKRQAAAQAKAMGQAAPDSPKEEDDGAAPRDRLKEYQESLKSKKPAKTEDANGLDDVMASAPPPAESPDGGVKTDDEIAKGKGMHIDLDWSDNKDGADGKKAAASSKGKKKKK